MISLIHYLTMLASITEVLINSFLMAKIFFRKGIFARDSVHYIYFLSIAGIASGLSAFPHLLLLFTFNNENCPSLKLALASVFRVFTTRLQFALLATFAIDRFVAISTPPFYQSFPRKQPAYLAAAVSVFLALFEVAIFLVGSDFNTSVKGCLLDSVGGPLYRRLYPFFHLVQFALVFLGAVSILIETLSARHGESRRLPSANYVNRWIFAVTVPCMATLVVAPLLLRFRVAVTNAIPDIFVFGDCFMHLNSCVLLPLINYVRSDLRRVVRIFRRKKVNSDTITVNTVNAAEDTTRHS
ncbi:hypothetical protein L596_027868 [Steinernema carpocapsae]|uniref:G-protein coupled receptors family 1 profile domain-containing protein n=1 Tax=Steinernema carpocapsae TaxID=34508 RepID=A0A4U5LWR9_STECR|nr:hypothetical protein L596_027868 [Steinernema carpocapsae]